MRAIVDVELTKFPTVLITDVHKDLDKVRKVKSLYPHQPIYCLGDICDLFDPSSGNNTETIQYFKENKIPSLMGNHEASIIADVLGKAGYIIQGQVKQVYNVSKEDAEYMLTFPTGFRFHLPDKTHYLCFHNRPDCLWSFTEEAFTEEAFLKTYPVDTATRAVVIGHQHKTFRNSKEYKTTNAYLQGIGKLQKSGTYALINEDGSLSIKIL